MKTRGEDVFAVMHALTEVPSNATVDMLRVTMKRVLVGLEEKFHFKRMALVCLNPEDWSIEHVFSARRREAATWLVHDFVSELRGIQRSSVRAALSRGADHHAKCCQRRYMQLSRSFEALALIVIPHDRLAVMLVAESRKACRKTSADSQILRMATELLALTIEKQRRVIEPEESARRAEVAQGAGLADGIGHELNNNLTAILGYAEMVAEAVLPSSPMHAYVEEILDAGRRAKLVVDRALMPARA